MYLYIMFNCELCNYSTNIKCNFLKHNKTNKHRKKMLGIEEEIHIKPHKPHNTTQKIMCEFCNKGFSRIDSLNRHLKNFCKENPDSIVSSNEIRKIKEQHKIQLENLDKEKKLLLTHIEKLLDHVGDTTNITNNQQIVLNCYGQEDLSHITETIKSELLKLPFVMIPKMIKAVHFNKNCPQNKNICIPNKNKPYVKIYSGNTWVFKDKREMIQELIDKNYFRLDNFYESGGKNALKTDEQHRYNNFQQERLDKDEVDKEICKNVEMILLNNQDNNN